MKHERARISHLVRVARLRIETAVIEIEGNDLGLPPQKWRAFLIVFYESEEQKWVSIAAASDGF
jgi:hypothetical protein